VALLAATGVVLCAAYMLVLYRRVVFGPVTNPEAAAMPDLTWKEKINFLPLAVLVLWLGIFPGVVMDKTQASVDKLIGQFQAGLTQPVPAADPVEAEEEEAQE
jgi:NADH-quinone oxidoreductase subunit M